MDAKQMARWFHEAYRELAPKYAHPKPTKGFEPQSLYGRLLVEACEQVLRRETLQELQTQSEEMGLYHPAGCEHDWTEVTMVGNSVTELCVLCGITRPLVPLGD